MKSSTVDAKTVMSQPPASQSQTTIPTVSRQPKIVPKGGLEVEEKRAGVGEERRIAQGERGAVGGSPMMPPMGPCVRLLRLLRGASGIRA